MFGEDGGFKEPEPKPSTKTSDKKLREADRPSGGLFGNSKQADGTKAIMSGLFGNKQGEKDKADNAEAPKTSLFSNQ